MSNAALRRPNLQTAPAPKPQERNLRLVANNAAPKAVQRPGLLPALLVAAVLGAVMVAQLCLSVLTSADAYELSSLRAQEREMVRAERVVQQRAEAMASPQNVAENAKSLGMVQNVQTGFLRLSSGELVGAAEKRTEAAVTNAVANANLAGVPVLNADGTTKDRPLRQADPVTGNHIEVLLTWSGELPVPETH